MDYDGLGWLSGRKDYRDHAADCAKPARPSVAALEGDATWRYDGGHGLGQRTAAATWTVPPARMKAKLVHRVPLSSRAVTVLEEAREIADQSRLVFPSPTGRVLSDSTLSKLLRELGIGTVPHGFRSSFRDWAAERADVPQEVCELALAHVNTDRVEAAYRRSGLFDRRRELMQAWAEFLSPQV